MSGRTLFIISLLSPQLLHPQAVVPPVGISVSVTSSKNTSTVGITLKWYAVGKFSRGAMYILASLDSGAAPDSILMWSGESNSVSFSKALNYQFKSKVGQKSLVKAFFRCQFENDASMTIAFDRLYIFYLADTVVTDGNSYEGLDFWEVQYEIRKGGYEHLTDPQLQMANHQLWKRLMKVRGQNRE